MAVTIFFYKKYFIYFMYIFTEFQAIDKALKHLITCLRKDSITNFRIKIIKND